MELGRNPEERISWADSVIAVCRGVGGCRGCIATWVAPRSVQGAGRADRFAVRPGIMRSSTSLTCRPQRHFGVVALHNRALRIIGDGAKHREDHLPGERVGVDLLRLGDKIDPEGVVRFQGVK